MMGSLLCAICKTFEIPRYELCTFSHSRYLLFFSILGHQCSQNMLLRRGHIKKNMKFILSGYRFLASHTLWEMSACNESDIVKRETNLSRFHYFSVSMTGIPFSYGWGQVESQFTMALPNFRGQVTNFSSQLFAPATNPKRASKGCRNTHNTAAKKASGQARNHSRTNQSREKIGLPMTELRNDFVNYTNIMCDCITRSCHFE